jgi:gliding motility-associated-like protein
LNVSNAAGCLASDTFNLTVHALPAVQAMPDTVVCDGQSLQLSVTGAANYIWSPATYLNDPLLSNPVATPVGDITYTVTGTDVNGCTATDQLSLQIVAAPVAAFTFVADIGCNGIRLTTDNQSTGATAYQWNFGDGSTSGEAEPVHFYLQSGIYNIQIVAINAGCNDTAVYAGVALSNASADSIPNIITPNNDGKNDCFIIRNSNLFTGCYRLNIYNRWGSKVYETSDALSCWNGVSDNNEALPEGTYFFTVDVGAISRQGAVTIVR